MATVVTLLYLSILCFGVVNRNRPYLQACLQAGEVVIPRSVYVTVLYAFTLSLASPTCIDDDVTLLIEP
jgi:hypothetical protein